MIAAIAIMAVTASGAAVPPPQRSPSPSPPPPSPALTLTRALELGRARAPALRAARARAEAAAAAVAGQRAAYYPTVTASLTGGAAALRDTQPLPPPDTGRFAYVDLSASATGAASLRWTLYDFGRTSGAVRVAEAGHAAAAAASATIDLAVASAVASAFVIVHHTDRLREVARAVLGEREKLVTLARGLVKAALQPPLEELRAEARADAARVLLAGAEAAAADASAALASLLALDPARPPRLAPPRLPPVDVDPTDAARAAEGLPSVAAAVADHDAARAAAAAAGARYRPTVALAADGSYAVANHDGVPFLLDTRRAAAGLVVSVPILDVASGAAVARARAEAAAAAAAADEVRRAARAEAVRAVFAARATAAARAHAGRAAEGAAAVLAVVEARYARGLGSPLELIDAEGAAADAQRARVEAELAHALAVVRVFTATGRTITESPAGANGGNEGADP